MISILVLIGYFFRGGRIISEAVSIRVNFLRIPFQTRPTDSEDLMDILRLRNVEMDFLSIMSPILDFASVGRIAQPLIIQVK